MNKHFKLLSLFFGLMVATTGFVACGGDDDDDDPPAPQPQEQKGGDETPDDPTPPANSLVGTWKIYQEQVVGNGIERETAILDLSITFKEDGSFEDIGNWSKFEGTWTKLGENQVVVNLTSESYRSGDNWQPNPQFQSHADTLDYFFKDNGNALFCESPALYGIFAYTRDGKLSFSGYSTYAGNAVLGVWEGEDYAYDGTPITLLYEFRDNGTFYMTMDNHQGWSEGMAGYYLLENGRMMLITYYFASKMGSATNDWEIRGFRLTGGHWFDYSIANNKLYGDEFISMSADVEFLVNVTNITTSYVGNWKSTETNNNVVEDEYWEFKTDGTVRHWWIRDGVFSEGTMGTYTAKEEYQMTYFECHFDHWLADSGDNTNPQQGDATGRETIDYNVYYVYSKVTDALFTQWPNSQTYEKFNRIK